MSEDSDKFIAQVKTNKLQIVQKSNSNDVLLLDKNTYPVWGKEQDFNTNDDKKIYSDEMSHVKSLHSKE